MGRSDFASALSFSVTFCQDKLMEITQHANYLVSQGKTSEAYSLLSSAAMRGDAEAAYQLAEWRMAGNVIRRDIAEARRLFGCAAKLGLQRAELPYTALLANGAGNIGRRWSNAIDRLHSRGKTDTMAQTECDLLMRMDIDEDGYPNKNADVEILSTSPSLCKLPQFMTIDECNYIIKMALPLLQPSVVVHPETGRMIQNPIRTSTAATFPFIAENPLLHAINNRIANATNTHYNQGEPVQILSYLAGQEYKPHCDALPNTDNQRIKTLLVYLEANFEGGETFFSKTGMRIRGKQGDAILFSNIDVDGRPDPNALHAGLPVRKGRKTILSKWIRAHALDLTGPANRPF